MDQLRQSLITIHKVRHLGMISLWEIDRVHMENRLPIFSSNLVGKDWDGEGEIGERIP